jgi:L-ornithine N5-oxygenase
VNKRDFFPTRHEYHDYLEWAASEFTDAVTYGAQAVAVRVPTGRAGEPIDRLRVDLRKDGAVFTVDARNVVISTGLVPRMPAGVGRHERVWHSSEFLGRFARCDAATLKRVAVVGGGQSAAELVRFLYDELPESTVYAVTPSSGYAVADSTPFVNEIFDAVAVDEYFHGSARA